MSSEQDIRYGRLCRWTDDVRISGSRTTTLFMAINRHPDFSHEVVTAICVRDSAGYRAGEFGNMSTGRLEFEWLDE